MFWKEINTSTWEMRSLTNKNKNRSWELVNEVKLSVSTHFFLILLKTNSFFLHSQTKHKPDQTKPNQVHTSSWSICMFNNIISTACTLQPNQLWNMIDDMIKRAVFFFFSLYCWLDLPLHAKRVLLFYVFM